MRDVEGVGRVGTGKEGGKRGESVKERPLSSWSTSSAMRNEQDSEWLQTLGLESAGSDDVLRTLILNEYFHLFFILDVIFCAELQQLPTHFLQLPLQTLLLYIYLFKLRDYKRRRSL